MTGNELIRKLKKHGRRHGVHVELLPRRGKGSHGTLVYGSRFTILRNPKDELKKSALHGILKQLDLKLEEL